MDIPKTLKIGGHEFKVLLVQSMASRDECYGKMWMDRLEIHIDSSVSKELQEETMLHEAIHAIDEENGLDLTEQQVQSLGHGIYQLIKTNDLIL